MTMRLRDKYHIVTDTVKIDRAIDDAARTFSGFTPTGKAVVGDARYEIRRLTGPYDLIILDCFTGGSEPAHLLTVETLTQLRGMLAKGGIVALNFVGFADHGQNPALASVAQTINQVFPSQSVFVAEPGDDFGDYIFLASDTPLTLDAKSLTAQQSDWLKARLVTVDRSRGIVLTDNLNPLEHLQTRKAEHYRHMIVEWLGTDLLVR
jgi:spermidine synthase